MNLPSPETQKAIAGPAIQNALDRGWNYNVLAMILGVSAQTLQDIHEGRGTTNALDWHNIEVPLRK